MKPKERNFLFFEGWELSDKTDSMTELLFQSKVECGFHLVNETTNSQCSHQMDRKDRVYCFNIKLMADNWMSAVFA